MEKQELQKAYSQCIEELVREAIDKGIINQDLCHRIAKLQRTIRECDILEEIKNQLGKKEIIEIPISKEAYFKPISKDYINLMPKKELYNNTLKTNTNAAVVSQDKAAQPYFDLTPQDIQQYINEKIDKMLAPQAAEFTQETAAQPNYSEDYKPRSK